MANYDYRYDDDYDPYEYEDIDDFDEEDFMIGYKDELLSKEDFKEMWLAICELFPEYDFLSYIKEFEETEDIETLREKLNNVTVDEIVELNKKINIQTIYLLKGDN